MNRNFFTAVLLLLIVAAAGIVYQKTRSRFAYDGRSGTYYFDKKYLRTYRQNQDLSKVPVVASYFYDESNRITYQAKYEKTFEKVSSEQFQHFIRNTNDSCEGCLLRLNTRSGEIQNVASGERV